MSRYKNVTNAFAKAVSFVIVIAIILGVAGVVAYLFIRPQGMYVRYGNEFIAHDNNGIRFAFDGSDIVFKIENSEGWGAYNVSACNVKIVPNVNAERDFKFVLTSDNSEKLFSAEKEYTKAFLSSRDSEYITVSESGEFAISVKSIFMKDILTSIYGEVAMSETEEYATWVFPYFAISVTSPDEKYNLKIPFTALVNVEGVELDKSEVVL